MGGMTREGRGRPPLVPEAGGASTDDAEDGQRGAVLDDSHGGSAEARSVNTEEHGGRERCMVMRRRLSVSLVRLGRARGGGGEPGADALG